MAKKKMKMGKEKPKAKSIKKSKPQKKHEQEAAAM